MGQRISLIGFGEAAETFALAADWAGDARAFDIDAARGEAIANAGCEPATDAATAVAGADIVLSLVTADAALPVAEEIGACAGLFCDMNSVAPGTKRRAASAIGENYVDVAVMAPVQPARLNVPLLVAGPQAADAAAALADIGFAHVRVVGDEVGRASAIKLVRSIMVKGMEALTAEMMLAAARAGVTDEVLASLDASARVQPWTERADYNLDRMMVHGRRRSAEMHEASEMLRELGLSPMMTDACVRWQEGLGKLDLAPPPAGRAAKVEAILAAPAFQELAR